MKYRMLGLALGIALNPIIATAHGVELQDFSRAGAEPPNFVLGTQVHPKDAPTDPDNRTADMVAEFSAMSARNEGKLELAPSPLRSAVRIPAWMQRYPTPVSPATQTNLATWRISEISGCAVDPYLPNPVLPQQSEQRRATWYLAMETAACAAGVPVNLFDALLIQESRYNPVAISPKGAVGIAQLMPDRARRLGVRNVWDPIENMRGAARYLRSLLDEFGRLDLALAAYNAGEGRVRGTGRVPRIRETVNYVSSILVMMRNELTRRLNSSSGAETTVSEATTELPEQRF